ncbi:unnamed protein product [Chrysodeixis includens]|uniref:Uncharacterized protein n=1 Tax=Chrysodeixis includens TaxID=689277 RepID=A0A9P0BXL7_CHRIL|nr:unnamed protein product [Chrysodeixis includens]
MADRAVFNLMCAKWTNCQVQIHLFEILCFIKHVIREMWVNNRIFQLQDCLFRKCGDMRAQGSQYDLRKKTRGGNYHYPRHDAQNLSPIYYGFALCANLGSFIDLAGDRQHLVFQKTINFKCMK